jgi:hypothetical protein
MKEEAAKRMKEELRGKKWKKRIADCGAGEENRK